MSSAASALPGHDPNPKPQSPAGDDVAGPLAIPTLHSSSHKAAPSPPVAAQPTHPSTPRPQSQAPRGRRSGGGC